MSIFTTTTVRTATFAAGLGIAAMAIAGSANAATGDINLYLNGAKASDQISYFEDAIDQANGHTLPWDQIMSPAEVAGWDAFKPDYSPTSDLIPLQTLTMKATKFVLEHEGKSGTNEDAQGTEAMMAGAATRMFLDTTGYQPGPAEIDALKDNIRDIAPINPDGAVGAWSNGFNGVK